MNITRKVATSVNGYGWCALNVAFGIFNITNALDPSVVPAWLLILIGATNLFIGGYALAQQRALEREAREFRELMEITEHLIKRHAARNIEIGNLKRGHRNEH